jgi:hypothetical protein
LNQSKWVLIITKAKIVLLHINTAFGGIAPTHSRHQY